MKTLIFDIETTPEQSWTWGRFKQFIQPVQLVKQSELLCLSFKWLGDHPVANISQQDYTHSALVRRAWELMNEADVVIAHNGWGFDVKMLNRFFIEEGLTPPAPFKVVDTLAVAKKHFRFPANSLKSIGQSLNLRQQKLSNDGFEMWLKCMEGDKDAWAEMIKYNDMDVLALEEMYLRMRPWITNHPNVALYNDDGDAQCPKCGSKQLQKRGFQKTSVSLFQRYQCRGCGGWTRERISEKSTNKILTNCAY